MTRPLDRNARLPQLREMDEEAGEFWVENPFTMPKEGLNISAYERNRLFLNTDGSDFVDASFASRADIDSDSRAVIGADFSGDGAPDLLVSSVGGGPLRLFENRFPSRARAQIELVGTKSNRMAIGARLTFEVGGQRIVRDRFPHNPGMGQGPVETVVGLGDVGKIDTLTVRWPNGETQHFKDVPVGPQVTIVEGEAGFKTAQ
ncbi:MAG: ASPIC/UnbV domain-containing protein [Acidobacteriota bacterium]|nr:ASPIC/UnbV domain-containing protein [Acidobacteriota bacterium]MDH3785226.1 ASPIC/UnbV domain-containing protein [Acidobacteriota bacterium]